MDTLTFIASVVRSLAWPVTLVATLFIVLRHGKKIAIFVKSIKYKDFEVTLRDDFEKATNIAEGIRVTLLPTTESEAASENEDEVLRIANIDPGLAIHKSWQKLEAKVAQFIQPSGPIRFTPAVRFMRRLQELEILNSEDVELFDRLRRIRNEVVHAHDRQRPLTIAEAVEYDQLVEILIKRLEQIRNEPRYIAAQLTKGGGLWKDM